MKKKKKEKKMRAAKTMTPLPVDYKKKENKTRNNTNKVTFTVLYVIYNYFWKYCISEIQDRFKSEIYFANWYTGCYRVHIKRSVMQQSANIIYEVSEVFWPFFWIFGKTRVESI